MTVKEGRCLHPTIQTPVGEDPAYILKCCSVGCLGMWTRDTVPLEFLPSLVRFGGLDTIVDLHTAGMTIVIERHTDSGVAVVYADPPADDEVADESVFGGMPVPCQPIGCDNGYHLPGCQYADIDKGNDD